ncbi:MULTISPECIES: transposase [Streptomyces]|uniref:transposase n=1 Tax=Streptomyces eurythermus TaxID=42237 RepID=UPI00167BACF4|nr:transposase [Streptomyces sp. MBT70]
MHRRFDTGLGRPDNCLPAIGLFLATEAGCVPVNWSLPLVDSWCADRERRVRTRIPAVHHRSSGPETRSGPST